MFTIIHAIIALLSVGYATYTYLRPTQTKLRINYGLVGATVVSGTYLTISMPSHLIEACALGLIYLGVVGVSISAAYLRLVRAQQ